MNILSRLLMIIFVCFQLLNLCCWGDDDSSTSTTTSNRNNITLTASLASVDRKSPNSKSIALTPSVYKMALVNFWLIKDDGTDVNITNPDTSNGNYVYTETRPMIINFSSEGQTLELLSNPNIPAGTYTGYKMQFLYVEMQMPIAFHLPSISTTNGWETDIINPPLEQILTRNMRLYFNAIDKYWKKDFTVEMAQESGEWYWLRRSIENNPGEKNFFIKVEDNDHPSGGSGPQSTIDLFCDYDFWGSDDDLDDSLDPIIVGTHSTAGGLNVSQEQSFTIPEDLSGRYININVEVDITDTMNHGEGTAPSGVTFFSDVLDLGPGYSADGPENYGDIGLHPMMPRFSITSTESTSNIVEDLDSVYQVPEECIENGWEEPEKCNTNYCIDHEDDEFCITFESADSTE